MDSSSEHRVSYWIDLLVGVLVALVLGVWTTIAVLVTLLIYQHRNRRPLNRILTTTSARIIVVCGTVICLGVGAWEGYQKYTRPDPFAELLTLVREMDERLRTKAPGPVSPAPDSDPTPPPPSGGKDSQLPPRKPRPQAPAPPPKPIDVRNTTSEAISNLACPPLPTDTKPNVTLKTGDLVVLGSGELTVLDSQMKPTTIASDGYLAEARGVAVDGNGAIYVSGMGCTDRKGAVVHVDAATGTQTPVVTGFERPMGLVFDADGRLLVGEESRGGEVYRIDLSAGTKQKLPAIFTPGMGVHSIALYPKPPDIYVADGPAFRVDTENYSVTSVQIDRLTNAQAIAISSSGEIYIGENNRPILIQAVRGQRIPVRVLESGSFQSFWGLALSVDQKTLYASTGVGMGGVYKMSLPLDGSPPVEVWKSARDGNRMMFVSVVKLRQ